MHEPVKDCSSTEGRDARQRWRGRDTRKDKVQGGLLVYTA
jgi:hypothetical protein